MNYHCFKQKVFVPLLVLPAVLGGVSASAQEPVVDTGIIDEAYGLVEQNFQEAAASQQRVIELSDEADELYNEYQEVSKIVDGLEVYNAGMRRTIDQQERTIAEYEESITQVAELQRQIPPLIERMVVALEEFIELDMPFQLDTRRQRIETIRDTLDDSSVNIAERFRLVLSAYQAEANYGRSGNIQHYTDTLEINGVERDVDMLRVGRIALLYQTSDQTVTGMWDKRNNQWVELEDSYRRPVSDAIRMAQQLISTDIIELPIPAPESAQQESAQ